MHHVEILHDPLRIKAMGTTRAGLLVAVVEGLFAATGVAYPETGDEAKRPFEFSTDDTPSLILAVVRMAAASAMSEKEIYKEVSFSLVTDKKAVGFLVGRKLPSPPAVPQILGIDGAT